MAILDLESTGLRGAAVPFVIGVAWVEDRQIEVVQWVLERVGGEAEMLADVFAELRHRGADPLVSFNGASFDLPLLRIRAARHGIGASEISTQVDHVDLLHPARRMFRGSWRDCRLSTLERGVLGLHRSGDIDGAEIPAVFWDYVQARASGGPIPSEVRGRMDAVCAHNLVDLVSLPALASCIAAQLRSPDSLERARRAARHWLRVDAEAQARRVLSRWVEPGLGPGPRGSARGATWREAALELATLERRARGLPRAARLWEAAWRDDPGCPSASDAWAKYLEHSAGDFGRALEVASSSRLPCPRRIGRLERRLARAREAAKDETSATNASDGTEPRAVTNTETRAEMAVASAPRHEARTSSGAMAAEAPLGVTLEHTSTRTASEPSAHPMPRAPGGPRSRIPGGVVDAEEGQRADSTALSGARQSSTSLLHSVEDESGVRRRYRLLR